MLFFLQISGRNELHPHQGRRGEERSLTFALPLTLTQPHADTRRRWRRRRPRTRLAHVLAGTPLTLIANDGTLVENYPPEVVGDVLKPKVAAQMRAALEKVVLPGGTATRAAVPGFRTAGKTGTVQKHNPKGGYMPNSYIVSFAGMMPAQDPAFVCVVVIDDPRTQKVNRYGGTIAAPAFGRIAARAAAYLNLKPTEPLPGSSAVPPVKAANRLLRGFMRCNFRVQTPCR